VTDLRVLIADDEPLARQRLKDLIDGVEWLVCIGETADGEATIEAIDRLEPDVVFLDVRMPGASGLEVLARISANPQVVFTTAYDRYAVAAFELQAVDYLLKPFSADRFLTAAARVRSSIDSQHAGQLSADRLASALNQPTTISRLFVRTRDKIMPLGVDEIVRLEAQGDFVLIHSERGSHLVYVPLKDLVARLDPGLFIRIHRSHVVNLNRIALLKPYDGHRLLVSLQDGTEIVASKTGSRVLKELVV